MLTAAQFRRIALGMQDAVEGAHMGHPDFRVHRKIFATLHPGNQWGGLKLTPDQQEEFVRGDAATFVPASGAWGRQGWTTVQLSSVDEPTLGEAMTLAWQNVVRARPAAQAARKRSAGSRRPSPKR